MIAPQDVVVGPEGEAGPAPTFDLGLEPGDPAVPASGVGPMTTPAPQPVCSFTVLGVPIPQGSHRGFAVNGHVNITDDNEKTKPWKAEVKHAAVEARGGRPTLVGPVEVLLTFVMPRPKGHYRTGRNAHLLRDSAPAYPATKPDGDKLARAILDALTAAGVWKDDSQVVHLDAWKVYARPEHDELPAAHVHVRAAS